VAGKEVGQSWIFAGKVGQGHPLDPGFGRVGSALEFDRNVAWPGGVEKNAQTLTLAVINIDDLHKIILLMNKIR